MYEYFNKKLNQNDGLILKQLLTGYDKMEVIYINDALYLLDKFLFISKEKETKDTFNWGKKKISKAILNQSIYHSYTSPDISKRLAKKALSINPNLIFDIKLNKQIARIIFAILKNNE